MLLLKVWQRDRAFVKLDDDYHERVSNIDVHTVVNFASNSLHFPEPSSLQDHHYYISVQRILFWLELLRLSSLLECLSIPPVFLCPCIDTLTDILADGLVSCTFRVVEEVVNHLVHVSTESLTFLICIGEVYARNWYQWHFRCEWMPSRNSGEHFQLNFVRTLCV